jgi:hypothetical protein
MTQPAEESVDQYLTASQAARELGTTRMKIGQLLKAGILPTIADPLDKRVKLIPVSALERLRVLREKREGRGEGRADPKRRTPAA